MTDDQCDRCGAGGEIKTLYSDGHVWAQFCIPCHDDVVEFALNDADEVEPTPQEEWEAHNESFNYDPPKKPADAWSRDEYQELHDRVISRRVEWLCDKCTGQGPFRSLQKARSHVESNHSPGLVRKYATPREELDAATDGGVTESGDSTPSDMNRSLGDFS